jgi:hypothetical protein
MLLIQIAHKLVNLTFCIKVHAYRLITVHSLSPPYCAAMSNPILSSPALMHGALAGLQDVILGCLSDYEGGNSTYSSAMLDC